MLNLTARPWLVALILCPLAYAVVAFFGHGRYRGEFLGLSLVVGVVGAVLLLVNRFVVRRFWVQWSGAFGLNWLFAAYLVSYFAV